MSFETLGTGRRGPPAAFHNSQKTPCFPVFYRELWHKLAHFTPILARSPTCQNSSRLLGGDLPIRSLGRARLARWRDPSDRVCNTPTKLPRNDAAIAARLAVVYTCTIICQGQLRRHVPLRRSGCCRLRRVCVDSSFAREIRPPGRLIRIGVTSNREFRVAVVGEQTDVFFGAGPLGA